MLYYPPLKRTCLEFSNEHNKQDNLVGGGCKMDNSKKALDLHHLHFHYFYCPNTCSVGSVLFVGSGKESWDWSLAGLFCNEDCTIPVNGVRQSKCTTICLEQL